MSNKTRHVNDVAFDGYEIFDSKEDVQKYRKSKIEDVQKNVHFVKRFFNDKMTVLEIGSGNSKFLYALEQHGILNRGYGIDLSNSRVNFAEEWKKDLKMDNVTNINSNFFDCNLEDFPDFDLVYCSDMAFQLFDPSERGNDVKCLETVYDKMKSGSKILLEIEDSKNLFKTMTNNEVRVWQEFDESDPWRYLLWECKYENDDSWIRYNKTFIKRDLSELFNSSIVLRNYSREEAKTLLQQNNFVNVQIFEYWKDEGDMEDDGYIIIGEKE